MMARKKLFKWNFVFPLVIACFTQSAPSWALEAKVFAIGDFVPSGSGGCGGNDISHWPNMVDKWYDHMAVHGHSKDGQYTNGTMTIRRFCDPDWTSGCQDYIYADEADAFMIATHGADNGDHWQGLMRSSWSSNCRLDAGGSADDMWVGDYDAEFVHVSSCFSADDDNVWGIRHALHDPVDGGYAHQWDGFHGIMWIGSGFDNDYKEFAHDAHSSSMSVAWVNNMYDSRVGCAAYDPFNWFGTCQEQCPVAYATGDTVAGALTRLNNERYNNVYADPINYTGAAIRYIAGCDSVGETSFSP